MATLLSRSEIAERLREEVARESTGTLIVRSQDAHAAMFVLEKGILISLSFGRLRGADAVDELVKLDSGSCQFNTLQLGHPQLGLPAVAEIIAMLRQSRADAPVAAPPKPHGDSTEPSTDRERRVATDAPTLTAAYPEDAVVTCISKVLVDYLGPIASVLGRSMAKKRGGVRSAEDAESLIVALSAELPDDATRARFEKAARGCTEKFK